MKASEVFHRHTLWNSLRGPCLPSQIVALEWWDWSLFFTSIFHWQDLSKIFLPFIFPEQGVGDSLNLLHVGMVHVQIKPTSFKIITFYGLAWREFVIIINLSDCHPLSINFSKPWDQSCQKASLGKGNSSLYGGSHTISRNV